MKEERNVTLRELVAKKQVFAPCIYDCITARAAEVAGFEAILLSGGGFSGSIGLGDNGLVTADDIVRQTQFVCDASTLPCIIDANDGFGATPLAVYRTTKRIAKAGAMALSIDDTTEIRGYDRWGMQFRAGAADGTMEHPIVPLKTFLGKIKAALEACEGTDCLLIARTEAKPQFGLDAAIERCIRVRELGVEMTMIIAMNTLEEAEKVAKYDPGWKMWPDVQSRNRIPDVELADIEKLGFNLVTTHILEGGAFQAMVDIGRHVIKDRNTVYADNYNILGLAPEERMKLRSMAKDKQKFKEKEARFDDIKI